MGEADVFVTRHRERCTEKQQQVKTANSYLCSLSRWLYLRLVSLNGFAGLLERS